MPKQKQPEQKQLAKIEETALAHLSGNRSVKNLQSYIYWVNQIPLLTEDEEQALARRLQQDNDLEAARKMVLAHLRFVVRIARGYSGYGLPQGDLIQEGNIGLMKAVKRFDPNVGVRLASFAIHWIRAEMHEFILKNWRIVKIATTKAQRKLFFNLRKKSKHLGWFSNEEIKALALELSVSEKDVRQMEARLNQYDQSLDYVHDDDEQTGAVAAIHHLEDLSANPATQAELDDLNTSQIGQLHAGLDSLDERSRDILEKRWLSDNKETLHELAAKYDVSAERIRQIEQAAMKKLKGMIETE